MPAGIQNVPTLDVFVTRLHESHEVAVYEAVERMVQAAEAVGLDAPALLRMLDRGVRMEELLEVIGERMERSQPAA